MVNTMARYIIIHLLIVQSLWYSFAPLNVKMMGRSIDTNADANGSIGFILVNFTPLNGKAVKVIETEEGKSLEENAIGFSR